jgi:hypothetical protein
MDYYELQKIVFDFLYKKHSTNPGFTFSVRRKASKGAERNYFIGTEKSNYFSFTLWSIPCWYRGASTEVISYIIRPEDNRIHLYLEYFMARNQSDLQNQYNIEFGKILEKMMKEKGWKCVPSPLENKMYTYYFSYPNEILNTDDLLKAIDDFIDKTQPVIQEAIDATLKNYRDWNAKRIDVKTFNENITKLKSKLERYANLNPNIGENSKINNEFKNTVPEYNGPLNFILYGPPGTGKTRRSISKAAEITEEREILNYDEALDIFNKNLHDQIEFITFHQNYSYEDFIQGLRPDVENKGNLSFEKKDGIFKVISDRALGNLRRSEQTPGELSDEFSFDKALRDFALEIENSNSKYPINRSAYISKVEDDAFRYHLDNWQSSGWRMKFSDLQEFYRNKVSRNDIKDLTRISGLAKRDATYYYLVYEKIRTYISKSTNSVEKVKCQNYVLIIDEINRANISRVFGELITLIEPDKRSHGKTPLKVKLPSGDEFIVPSNLYIIGTMNTADKSIALLDIALRRRFVFEDMYPEYDIPGCEIFDIDVLKKINEQIIETKGHDFQIGHSYFMDNPDNLVERMNHKVIPLLLEYYMNDEKEVKKILNDAGLEIIEGSWPIKISGKRDKPF